MQAFSSLADGVAEQLAEDPDTAQLVIQHHVIRGKKSICILYNRCCNYGPKPTALWRKSAKRQNRKCESL